MKINHFPPSIKILHLNFNVFLRIYPIVIISTISLFMTGCNPIYYAPNSLNIPLFTEAGETNLTLAGNKRQAEFQGAHIYTESKNSSINLPFRALILDNIWRRNKKYFKFFVGNSISNWYYYDSHLFLLIKTPMN